MPNNKRFDESVAAIAKLITSPKAAEELYRRAYMTAGGYVPQENWASWDALSGRFEAAWDGLMHAEILKDGLLARANELVARSKAKQKIASEPNFAMATITLLALHRAVALRCHEMTTHIKSKQAESVAQVG